MLKRAKVFLSSSQFGDEFKVEREVIPVLFDKEPLNLFFDLWRIEDQAASIPPQEQYILNIDSSEIVLLLIDNLVRSAVRDEYNKAKEKKAKIFVFIKRNDTRNDDAVRFIKEIQESGYTTTTYEGISNLGKKIEDSLIGFLSSASFFKKDSNGEKEKFDLEDRTLRIALALLNKNESDISKIAIMKIIIKEKMFQKEVSMDQLYDLLALYDKVEIDKAFSMMLDEHQVLSIPGNLYKLREDIKIEFENGSVEVDLYEKTAIDVIYGMYSDNPKLTFNKFSTLLTECISLIIYWTTLSAKNTENGENVLISSYDSESLKALIIEASSKVIEDKSRINIWYLLLKEVLFSEREEIVFWINCIKKSYWFLAMMGLDPEISKLYSDNLKEYKIYLDSHIVIRAMVQAGSEAQICKEIIEKSKGNNVEMYLSKPIYDEIEIGFHNADKMYRNCKGDIKRITDLLDSINRRSDIIDGFIYAKDSNPGLDWDSYIIQFYSRQNENILKQYIENELGIEIEAECDFDEGAWGEIQEFYSELIEKRAGNLKKRKEKTGNVEEEDIRQMNLRTNEAKQLETIYRYKQKGENNYWFVTYDSFIYRVCSDIYRKNEYQAKYYPCYLKPNKWLEIINLSTKNSISMNTFREILMSPNLHLAVNVIEAKVVNQILEKQLDKKVKDKTVLRNMFRETVKKTATEDIEKDLAGKNPNSCSDDPEMESFIKRVLYEKMKDYESILSAQDRELTKARKERQKAVNKANYYKSELTKIVKGKSKKGKK